MKRKPMPIVISDWTNDVNGVMRAIELAFSDVWHSPFLR